MCSGDPDLKEAAKRMREFSTAHKQYNAFRILPSFYKFKELKTPVTRFSRNNDRSGSAMYLNYPRDMEKAVVVESGSVVF